MKTLYWIDDKHDQNSPPKGAAKKRLEEGLNVNLKVETISERSEFGKLLSDLDIDKTCGVIMDYQLTKVGEKGQTAYGNTWAAEIRAAHPRIPVIGISHEREADIPKLRLEGFLAFFSRNKLTGPNPPLCDVLALLIGYAQVYHVFENKAGKSGVDLMIDLLLPPAPAVDLVKAALTPSLRASWDVETPHAVGRWIWHELQGLPGFLFDELGLATHLGLTVSGLQRVRSKFDDARYKGAFASDGRPRWWVVSIRGIVEQLVGIQVVGSVSLAREELLKAVKIKTSERGALFSRPYGRRGSDEVPDCIAYRDDLREEDDRVQVLFEDTYIDDRDINSAFGFEPRRIFAPRKQK